MHDKTLIRVTFETFKVIAIDWFVGQHYKRSKIQATAKLYNHVCTNQSLYCECVLITRNGSL